MSEIIRRNAAFRAQLAFASGANVKEAAAAANVTDRTVRRWMREDPDFLEETRRLRGELVEQAAGKLASAAAGAVDELVRMFTSGRSEMARVLAARAVLEHMIPYRMTIDLEARFADIEAKADFLAESERSA